MDTTETRRFGEASSDRVVRIGEAWHASQGVLRATLGSCVGIGLIWRARGQCALAHCLLPSEPRPVPLPAHAGSDSHSPARYVDRALPALFRLLGADSNAYGEIEAVLVGGASLAKLGRGAAGQIGLHNIEGARKCLAAAGLRVVLEQVGGTRGWQVTIDADAMTCSAREIATPNERLNSTFHEASHGHARTR